MSFQPAEISFLASHKAQLPAWYQQYQTEAPIEALARVSWAKKQFGQHSRCLIELFAVWDKHAEKLPSGLLADNEAAQQATHQLIAAARAEYLHTKVDPTALIVDVTCSIGTELYALQQAGFQRVIGADLSQERIRLAAANVPVPVVQADALAPVVPKAAVMIADPARRAGGRRIMRPEDLLPPLPQLIAAYPGAQQIIKCAPGLDYQFWLEQYGGIICSSVNHSVKETCLWSAPLQPLGERTAWIFTNKPGEEFVQKVYTSSMNDPRSCPVGELGRFVLDPDGAIVRAGLVQQFAVAHDLGMLDERIAYVTGDQIPAGCSGFEVIETCKIPAVKQRLRELDCGPVEILIRGIAADPDKLRKQWKLKGKQSLAVILTRIGSAGVAIICAGRTHN